TVLSVGIQLFVMTLIIGIGQSFIDQYFSVIKDDVPDLNSLIVLLLASIVLLVLTNRLPQLLSGIVGGASLHGMGGFGAGMIAGATTAISSAGSIALSATAQASGGASALKAAFESAQAAMAEESGSGNGAGSSGA
ncbi:P-type conjugative transfer protein TrbL, partial [Escherichia coli]|nr:P-type conjugative transfer protein TrbL [Escherichia coli]